MWSTREYWKDNQNRVALLRDGKLVADMSLDDWANLPPTAYLITEARQATAEALRQEAAGNTELLDHE